MDAIARVPVALDAQGVVVTRAFGDLVDLYWLALASFRTILEDIEGADGRHEYLISLRCKLVEVCQEMDELLAGTPGCAGAGHRLAIALVDGMPHFGLNAREVVERLYFACADVPNDELQAALLAFGDIFARRLPGQIPEAQSPVGQGQTLRAIRNWSAAAGKTGTDLGFLAARFREL
jgi:hypothetical protein